MKPSPNLSYLKQELYTHWTPVTFPPPPNLSEREYEKGKLKKMGLQSKLMLMAMAILAVTSLTEAQNNIPSCASKLVQCSNFINSKTQPDATCCNAIKDAVANELPCLCSLFNSGVLSSFNISVTEALRITKECNVPGDLSNCNGMQTFLIFTNKKTRWYLVLSIVLGNLNLNCFFWFTVKLCSFRQLFHRNSGRHSCTSAVDVDAAATR